MYDHAIRTADLAKSFCEVRAVQGVSFQVERGEFFGFLGPNGAGKTTTINMLTGLARPDGGTVSIAGIDCTRNVKAAQHLIGVVPDESSLYPELTGMENLRFCGALYGMTRGSREKRADELISLFGLKKAGGRKFGGYSRGMKRKLTIAAGIMHRPEILFLDEPTTGIDVASAREIRTMLSQLHSEGTTVFLTTHYIEEAQRLCDRIAFIVQGRIVKMDTLENLLKPVKGRHVLVLAAEGPVGDIQDLFSTEFPGLRFWVDSGSRISVESQSPFPIAPLTSFLEEHGVSVLEAARRKPSLEDVFVSVTGLGGEAMK